MDQKFTWEDIKKFWTQYKEPTVSLGLVILAWAGIKFTDMVRADFAPPSLAGNIVLVGAFIVMLGWCVYLRTSFDRQIETEKEQAILGEISAAVGNLHAATLWTVHKNSKLTPTSPDSFRDSLIKDQETAIDWYKASLPPTENPVPKLRNYTHKHRVILEAITRAWDTAKEADEEYFNDVIIGVNKAVELVESLDPDFCISDYFFEKA